MESSQSRFQPEGMLLALCCDTRVTGANLGEGGLILASQTVIFILVQSSQSRFQPEGMLLALCCDTRVTGANLGEGGLILASQTVIFILVHRSNGYK